MTLIKNHLPTLISLFAIFFTVSGGLWHLGYWSTFNCNYFEYASFTDLFKSSIYSFLLQSPYLIGLYLALLGFYYLLVAYIVKKAPQNKSILSSNIIDNKNKALIDLSIGSSFFLAGILWVLVNDISKYKYLSILLTVGLVLFLLRIKMLGSLIKTDLKRLAFYIVLVGFPIINFFSGKSEALDILFKNMGKICTIFNSGEKTLNQLVVGKPLLGSSSEYLFFLIRNDPGHSRVLIVKKEKVLNFSVGLEYQYENKNRSPYDYYDSIPFYSDYYRFMKMKHDEKKFKDSIMQLINEDSAIFKAD